MEAHEATTNESPAYSKEAAVAAVKDRLDNPAEGVWSLTDEWSETDSLTWGRETAVGDVLIEVESVKCADEMRVVTHKLAEDGSAETRCFNAWLVPDTEKWTWAFTEKCPEYSRSDDE